MNKSIVRLFFACIALLIAALAYGSGDMVVGSVWAATAVILSQM
jgi:hypothetical protein